MKSHHEESVKAEDLLTRLDELEKEEAKVVWMEKETTAHFDLISENVVECVPHYKIIYKK